MIPVVTLIVIGIQIYDSIKSSQIQINLVLHTHETINSLKDVLISTINAETDQRGFVITGNDTYLEPYNSSLADLNAELTNLRTLVSDNVDQESKLNQSLIPLLEKRLTLLNSGIEARQKIGFSAASRIILTGQGKMVMDQIRKTISTMITEEEDLLKSRSEASSSEQQHLLTSTLISILVSSVVTVITLLVTYSKVQFNFEQINNLLESKVEKRTEELAFANAQLETANRELKFHDELQKEFINIAAHELRTPTQAILGYADMLEISPDRNRSYEEAISRNASRLYTLSSDILDVSRIESKTFKLVKSHFDLNLAIENIIKELMTRHDWEKIGKKVKLVFSSEESLILFGDEKRIGQVILNLVDNALKFTEIGTITIEAKKNNQSDYAVVTVTDTGTGIDKEILPRLFLKFASKSKSGTGLGLFMSKAIVEAHGGSIQGYNNVGSQGSTFRFTIPLKDRS